jgi:hypothetical protein
MKKKRFWKSIGPQVTKRNERATPLLTPGRRLQTEGRVIPKQHVAIVGELLMVLDGGGGDRGRGFTG